MRHLLWLLATLFVLANASPGAAGERRLPSAPALAQTLNAKPAAAMGFRQLRQKAVQRGRMRVIVGLRIPFAAEADLSPRDAARQRSDIAGGGRAVANRLPAAPRNLRSLDTLPYVAMDVTARDLDALTADPNVFAVTEDREVKLQLAESVPLIQGDLAWSAGYRGLGETVAIIDSGVDKAHPFLFGKVVSEACYSAGGWCPGGRTSSTEPGSARPCSASGCLHGTHVAGIAAGMGSRYSGVAKDASIIAIQVMSPGGKEPTAYSSDIVAGLLRVYDLRNSFRIAAVNMSLGTEAVFSDNCDLLDSGFEDPMKTAIDLLRSAGIATIIASGNSYSSEGVSSPACISSAISVGAVSDSAWGKCAGVMTATDQVTCYSNSGQTLSLLAPGSLITSSVPNGRYASLHGTSMAAPHVAGAWAVLKEKSPDTGVDEVLAAFTATGKPVRDSRNGLSRPRINVLAALGRLSDGRRAIAYTRARTAPGTVSFSPTGTVSSCTQDCFNRFAPGTDVNMTATPAAGASFFGWGGACSGTGACRVTMSSAKAVTAGFYTGNLLSLAYGQSGTGAGSVSFSTSGFDSACSASCTRSYWKNATVRLAAAPATGSYFAGWTGVCKGTKTYCDIRLSSAKSVGAVFKPLPVYALTYARLGTGGGTVSFGVSGVEPCTASCTRNLYAGTAVTLIAEADDGSAFVGWSGVCKGPKQMCTLTINGPIQVSAEFRSTAAASAR